MSIIRLLYDPTYTPVDFHHLADGGHAQRIDHTRNPFITTLGSRPLWNPTMDLHEDDVSNLVTAKFELPGLKKEDITIDVHRDHLVISGESNTAETLDEQGFTLRERRSGKFHRTVPIPKGTQPEDISAKMDHGVLTITFPKTHPDETPIRITIV